MLINSLLACLCLDECLFTFFILCVCLDKGVEFFHPLFSGVILTPESSRLEPQP